MKEEEEKKKINENTSAHLPSSQTFNLLSKLSITRPVTGAETVTESSLAFCLVAACALLVKTYKSFL